MAPPDFRLPLLAAGLAGLGLFSGLGGLAARRSRAARAGIAVAAALLGLVAGTLGCVLTGLASLTDHAVTFWNANILLFPPFAVALAALAPGVARGTPRALSRARGVAAFALGTSIAVALLWSSGLTEQKNLGFIALMLPIWLGAFLALSLQLGSRNR
jgi:hypothetical protein